MSQKPREITKEIRLQMTLVVKPGDQFVDFFIEPAGYREVFHGYSAEEAFGTFLRAVSKEWS